VAKKTNLRRSRPALGSALTATPGDFDIRFLFCYLGWRRASQLCGSGRREAADRRPKGLRQPAKSEPGESRSFALLFSASKKIEEFSLIYRHPAAVAKGVVTR